MISLASSCYFQKHYLTDGETEAPRMKGKDLAGLWLVTMMVPDTLVVRERRFLRVTLTDMTTSVS